MDYKILFQRIKPFFDFLTYFITSFVVVAFLLGSLHFGVETNLNPPENDDYSMKLNYILCDRSLTSMKFEKSLMVEENYSKLNISFVRYVNNTKIMDDFLEIACQKQNFSKRYTSLCDLKEISKECHIVEQKLFGDYLESLKTPLTIEKCINRKNYVQKIVDEEKCIQLWGTDKIDPFIDYYEKIC